MIPVELDRVKVGDGFPKICVPIVSGTREAILLEVESINELKVELAEWRLDCYEDVFDNEKMLELLYEIRKNLRDDIAIIATFRTLDEGGNKEIEREQYWEMICDLLKTRQIAAVDVQIAMGRSFIEKVVNEARAYAVKVIASNHVFDGTPDKNEMISRLCSMQGSRANITKLAVMANEMKDVLTVLETSYEMKDKYADRPFIIIAMSEHGIISRLTGQIFGSAITFATSKEASAPGQIDANDTRKIIDAFRVLGSSDNQRSEK